MNSKQEERLAEDAEYLELVKDIPPEVLVRIELAVETRWMDEFRNFADSHEQRVMAANQEASRWRWLSVSLARKADIGQPLSSKLMLPTVEELESWEQEQFDALLEKFELYLRMGQDFETILAAIKSNDAVESCWDRLMVAMRLAGMDEKPQA